MLTIYPFRFCLLVYFLYAAKTENRRTVSFQFYLILYFHDSISYPHPTTIKACANERNMLAQHRPTLLGKCCAMLAEGVQTITTCWPMLRVQ